MFVEEVWSQSSKWYQTWDDQLLYSRENGVRWAVILYRKSMGKRFSGVNPKVFIVLYSSVHDSTLALSSPGCERFAGNGISVVCVGGRDFWGCVGVWGRMCEGGMWYVLIFTLSNEPCKWPTPELLINPMKWALQRVHFHGIRGKGCWMYLNACHACVRKVLKEHNLLSLPNKIRLNLINTFVMSRNKHISKKTPCFSRKRSKNKVKPNEFERRILKLSCYACSENPKCRHEFSIFRNASSQNEFRFNLLRCMTETSSAALQ